MRFLIIIAVLSGILFAKLNEQSCIEMYTIGEYQKVIKECDYKNNSFNQKVYVGLSLFSTGDMTKALKQGELLEKISKTDTQFFSSYNLLSNVYYHKQDKINFLKYATKQVDTARKIKDKQSLVFALN